MIITTAPPLLARLPGAGERLTVVRVHATGEVIVLTSRGMPAATIAERARPLLDQGERQQLRASLGLDLEGAGSP